MIMGYKAPSLRDVDKDSDPYALEMYSAPCSTATMRRASTSTWCASKRSLSRLAIDYDASARGPGMIYLSGSPAEGKTVPELEAALRSEIERVKKEGVSEQELKRAKAQLLASQVYKQDLGCSARQWKSARPNPPASLSKNRTHAGKTAKK